MQNNLLFHLEQLHKITTSFVICVYFLVDIYLKNARRLRMLMNFLCILVLHSFLFCVLDVILLRLISLLFNGGSGCIFIPVYRYRNSRKEKEQRCNDTIRKSGKGNVTSNYLTKRRQKLQKPKRMQQHAYCHLSF